MLNGSLPAGEAMFNGPPSGRASFPSIYCAGPTRVKAPV
jgi:hypothetical protein